MRISTHAQALQLALKPEDRGSGAGAIPASSIPVLIPAAYATVSHLLFKTPGFTMDLEEETAAGEQRYGRHGWAIVRHAADLFLNERPSFYRQLSFIIEFRCVKLMPHRTFPWAKPIWRNN